MRCVLQNLAVLTALAGVGSLVGCTASEGTIAGGQATLVANENSAAFLDRMSSLEGVTENDAMRGILMVLEGRDTAKTFKQRVQALRNKGILPAGADLEAGRPVTRGRLAYMIYQACKIPGGVILRLAGPSQRYCLRELQYRDMMRKGFARTPVNGMEFVEALTRAEVYRRTGKIPDRAGQIEDG